MVRKIIVCVSVAFFAIIFLACSSRPDPKTEPLKLVTIDHYNWTQVTEGKPFPWDEMDGFYYNEEHLYGFDRYPASEQNGMGYVSIDSIANVIGDSILLSMYGPSGLAYRDDINSPILNHERGMKNTDSVVYISVLSGDSGKVILKINQNYQDNRNSSNFYNYYICKPDYPYNIIAAIDNSQKEIPYTISSNEEIIALCKESETGIQKVQELEIRSYGWKLYNFYVYILGDSTNVSSIRHQLLNSTNFWDVFDSVYAQAVVKHGDLRGEFKTINSGYALTKASGNYLDYCNYSSDIDNAIKEVRTNMRNGGLTKNIIQVGYPTKKFWPLKYDGNGNIQICGTPNRTVPTTGLELESLPGCSLTKEASVFRDGNVWKLSYKNEALVETADISNINPECIVFAETSTGDYVGEVKTRGGENSLAITTYYGSSSIIIQPWLGDNTTKTVLHELGHSMRLLDIFQTYPSSFPPSYISDNNEENNLMIQGGSIKSLKLRQRGILTIPQFIGLQGLEYQWNCLQGIPKSCSNILWE
jgi:hypothetical protein